jgi:DTW domain-containing protein YfiP
MELEEDRCADCRKPRAICVCDRITPIETRTRVLVLQHPQEDDRDLGTVPLLARTLPRCVVRVGLSWASLEDALGDDDGAIDRNAWSVIYPTKIDPELPAELRAAEVMLLDKKGRARDRAAPKVAGVVALDGTWSQAKTLWWRNPWLLKLGRIVIQPREASIYGKIRREPRREHVSTLEAVADALVALGEAPEVRDQLRRSMRTMVQRARDAAPR